MCRASGPLLKRKIRMKALYRRSCRTLWVIVKALLLSLTFTLPSSAQSSDAASTRLVLLGTAGGPSIKKARAQPANAVIVGDAVYIIDAGDGVARQLGLAGISAQNIRAVFITHLHSDHVIDYGVLLHRAWLSGLKTPVATFGPTPLSRMKNDYLEYMRWDIDLRIVDEDRVPLDDLITATEIEQDGVIYKDENVTVTAFEVPHAAAKPSYGFRFDTEDRSIVFSGDTARSQNLIKHAKGADILVHEIVSIAGVDAIVERIEPGNEGLKRHIIEAHTTGPEIGQIAKDAGVGKLVLTHFVPAGVPDFDQPDLWVESIGEQYTGEVVVGEDLMEID